MKALITGSLILLGLSGCGTDRKSEDESKREPEITQQTPSVPVTVNQPAIPQLKTKEEECKERAADFDWVGEKCIEKPNLLITGLLDITTGTVWSPSSANCTEVQRVNSENTTKRFQRCAGFDVTVPLAKPLLGKGINTLRISYNCAIPVEFPVEVKLGSTIANVASRKDDETVFFVNTPVEAESNPTVSMKFIPDYKKVFGAFAVSFPEACRIFILENSVSPTN